MPTPFFHFKQFTVRHDRCAMKIGTDGVLLGAWSAAENRQRILDVGTGTGLIALMMAQRNPAAHITAVEIDPEAYLQACENTSASPWADRVEVQQADFKTYATETKFDLIVSNPPFFINSLPGPDHKRNLARHTGELTYADLLQRSAALLTPTGELDLIFPATEEIPVKQQAMSVGLFPHRQLNIYPTPDSAVKRILLGLSFSEKAYTPEEMVIEMARHRYSEAYVSLTKEFYLNM
ncbi:MAG: methyltransferase [Bacteroides sp.]|nr:methyltransferase [Bacteroides sp.]